LSFFLAVVLGIVEGLTEFLPVSSTGHLILTSHAAGFHGHRAEVFEIFIQLGAVLAVVLEYRKKLTEFAATAATRAESRRFLASVGLAFVPAAVAGLLLHDWISETLFSARMVAVGLVAGAVLILVVESLPLRPRVETAEATRWPQALGIGLAQCLALWPGFSRSAATILGGLMAGLRRPAATEFSFFLAIPTLGAATVYSLVKRFDALLPGDLFYLSVAFVVSFVVAWWSIRWLLRFVSTHTLRPFAWYRLIVGAAILYWMR
jgi:undecaprenyl-diphosphatase